MKVLLIQPTSKSVNIISKIFQPLCLGYLASYLEERSHKVKIIDSIILGYDLTDIKKEIEQFDPDVVGVTSVTENIFDALSIIKITKEINPNCLTVIGGPHSTALPRETLEICSELDVIVRGEGEITFSELLEKKKKEDFVNVKGISFRLNDRIIENEDRKIIEDLDSLPLPAYHLLSMDKYKITKKHRVIDRLLETGLLGGYEESYSTISTCRGCPFDCNFCASCKLWGKKWRGRSPESVVQELKILRYKYGKKLIDFMDDTFSFDKKRTLKICQLIREEGIDISWECSTRVDLFNKEIANAFKKSGCSLIYFGMESGVQKTLDFLNKGFKVEDSIRAVKIAKEAGIDVTGAFIIGGIPGETKETINQTIAFAKKLNISYSFTTLVPFPGTKIYEYAIENNLLLTRDWSKYKISHSVLKTPGFSPEELRRIMIKANLVCNIRPQHILKVIKRNIKHNR